jgi:hypothetical protein
MGVGNFTEFEASGPNARSALKAVLATSFERKGPSESGPPYESGAVLEAPPASVVSSKPQHEPSAVGHSELLAVIEWSRQIVDSAGGALFCGTATGHVWVLATVTSAVSAALKLAEHVPAHEAFHSFHLRVVVDLGDVEGRTVNGAGAVFERVQAQVEKWPGPGIACSLAAVAAIGRGSKFDFRSGPLPDTLTPTVL